MITISILRVTLHLCVILFLKQSSCSLNETLHPNCAFQGQHLICKLPQLPNNSCTSVSPSCTWRVQQRAQMFCFLRCFRGPPLLYLLVTFWLPASQTHHKGFNRTANTGTHPAVGRTAEVHKMPALRGGNVWLL